MIGHSLALAEALDHISRLATVNRPVLVLGERGTGKELAAERLHFLSPRWECDLIKVNCAAMADTLLESELFGHEAGAFTGATRSRKGRFERADGGTLFLDELGTMSMRLQEKLLRLVEYGEFERLGGQHTLRVDVRVVAATNSDLRQLAAEHLFREDLLDRLTFDVVHLPALRQRREDIPELAAHFAIAMCRELGWPLFAGFTPQAMNILQNHHWPGNVRELKSAVERSLHRWADPDAPVDDICLDPFRSPFAEAMTAGVTSPAMGAASTGMDTSEAGVEPPGFAESITDYEKKLLQAALAANGQNQRRAAQDLKLTYNQMRGLVRKHKLARRRRQPPGENR